MSCPLTERNTAFLLGRKAGNGRGVVPPCPGPWSPALSIPPFTSWKPRLGKYSRGLAGGDSTARVPGATGSLP